MVALHVELMYCVATNCYPTAYFMQEWGIFQNYSAKYTGPRLKAESHILFIICDEMISPPRNDEVPAQGLVVSDVPDPKGSVICDVPAGEVLKKMKPCPFPGMGVVRGRFVSNRALVPVNTIWKDGCKDVFLTFFSSNSFSIITHKWNDCVWSMSLKIRQTFFPVWFES